VSVDNILTGTRDVTLLDIADRLLDTGVSLTGDATITVADVDLIYLGLSVALMSVERAERGPRPAPAARGRGAAAAGKNERGAQPLPGRKGPKAPARTPATRASGGLARNVPNGPGAMRALPEELPVELGRKGHDVEPARIAVDPDDVERGLAKLVLTIVDFVRQLLERQAIRRMEAGSLTEGEVERVGVALMRLEEKVGEMAGRFGIERKDLTLRLGPLGDLL
jgi:hypothetical protein